MTQHNSAARWLWRTIVAALLLLAVPVVRGAQAQEPTRTPFPSLTPSPTVDIGVATGQPLPTLTPSATQPGPTPTSPLLAITNTPNLTPQATQPLVQQGGPPPLEIPLPRGWVAGYAIVPARVALEAYPMNVAIYRGPVSGGVGNIVVLWGFPGIAPLKVQATANLTATPGGLDEFTRQMLWTDGLRLLQGTVLDITCNVGTAGQQDFSIGGRPAVGTFFNVSQCQGEPDTAGWFAGVRQYDRSFLFYAFIEPIEAYNDARREVQAVLDGVTFTPPATPTATATP